MREGVFELTEGKGANAVFDTVGGPIFEQALRSLRNRRGVVVITSTGRGVSVSTWLISITIAFD